MGESVGILTARTSTRQGLGRSNLVVRRSPVSRLRSHLYPLPPYALHSIFYTLSFLDEETAQVLYEALPKGSEVTVERLHTALQDFRRQSLGFEVRVKQAVASLGLRMAA